jgi:hypothetical protein
MVSTGTMILILILFLVAVSVSFSSGFFIGKKTVKMIPPQGIKTDEPVYEEPKQSFFDKLIELIDDKINRKKDESANEEVKTVITSDGIAKNENTFY